MENREEGLMNIERKIIYWICVEGREIYVVG